MQIVDQVYVSDSGDLAVRPYELDPQTWNTAYNFVDVGSRLSPSDRRLLDPVYLILRSQMEFIVREYRHFIVSQLANIGSWHRISCKGLRKDVILSRLLAHKCNESCKSLLYIFRQSTRMRPLQPWVPNPLSLQISPPSQGHSSTLNMRAIPNTASRHILNRSVGQPTVRTIDDSAMAVNAAVHWASSTPLRAAFSKTPCNPIHLITSQTLPQPRFSQLSVPSDAPQRIPPPAELNHLRVLTDFERRAIIQEWQKATALDRFLRNPCAVCSTLIPQKEVRKVEAKALNLKLLRNDELPPFTLPTTYNLEAYDRAILDPYGMEDRHNPRTLTICKICQNDLKRGLMPRFALANWLYYARDELPSDVRAAFQEMSVFEKALICRARTNSILCRFRGFDSENSEELFSKRMRHIKGNIISTPLDVIHLNELLPPSPQSIGDTMCALLISSTLPTKSTIDKLHPILVRKSRVKLLIQFLIRHNPHYQKSQSFQGFSSSHLDSLFEGTSDVGIPTSVRIGHLPINEAIEASMADYSGRLDEIEGLTMENISYTLGDRSAFSYRQMSLQALQHCKEGRPFLSSRSGTQPVPDINNPNWLSWAHPNADPFGIGAFHHPRRKRPIGMEQQLRHLLSVRDPFFENDPELSFDVYNIIRKGSVNTSLRFCVPYPAYSNIVKDIIKMDRVRLSELRQAYRRDPNYQPQTDEERRIIRTMTSISPIARKIPGSVAQKIKMRNEIRAIISQKGSPSLFVTLNPADYYNPIVTVLANRCSDPQELIPLHDSSLKQRTTAALRHPVACAQFFDFMIKTFIRTILRYNRKAGKTGIFGECDAYYGTVETQGRGSLHCHMLIWLRGHLPPEKLASTLRTSEEYRTQLTQWLDSIVSSGFQGYKSAFNELPSHTRQDIGLSERHPSTLPGPDIHSLEPTQFQKEMNEYLDELLLRFNWHIHTGTCWKYLRSREPRTPENCRFGLDGTSIPSTTIDPLSGTIQIKRLHPRMTHFNPTTTFLMKCNTDVKFIGSGEDAKAFMYYVTDYITKAPLSMYAGLTALSYAIRQGEARGVLNDQNRGESDNRRAMTIAVNSMLGHQEISHPQVMGYILGNGEYYTNESFQPINWAEVLRYIEASLQSLNPDPPDLPHQDERAIGRVNLSVSVERGKMSASSQLLDYIFRPDVEPFANMGLYTFLASTRKVSKPSGPDIQLSRRIALFTDRQHPQYHTHALKLRDARVVPVLLGPRIPRRNAGETERDRWARDVYILFRPWRNPADFLSHSHDWYQSLQSLLPSLSDVDKGIIDNMSLLSEAKQARDARPRRTKQTSALENQQISINSLIDTEIQDTNPHIEHNIFSYLQTTGHAGDEAQSVVATEIPSRLTALIGDEAAAAFGRYLNMHDTLSGDDENTKDPTDIARDMSNGALEEQATFMKHSKNRNFEATLPNDDESEVDEHQLLPGPLRPPGEAPPSASIQLIIDDFWNSKRGKSDEWKVAKRLIQTKNIASNPEQSRAFQIIAHHAIEGGPQLLMYIGGRGGSGKSYLIETIVELFSVLSRTDELRLGAPTGIAAALIGGTTLHSLFAVGANYRSSDKNGISKRLVQEWRGVKYLIVDETSMLSAQFLAVISARLKMAKGDAVEESLQPFGGINIIFTGDFYQLSPPKQPSLFSHRLVRDPTFLQTRDNDGLDSIAGAYLWRHVNTVVLLKENKRQKEDATLAELLDRVRMNTCVDSTGRPIRFAGADAIEHLRRREFSYVVSRDPSAMTAFQDAPVIVGSKPLRDTLNACLLVAHAKRLGREVHVYHSKDLIHREKPRTTLASTLWELTSRVTGESFGRLPLFVGMRVMVTENVSIPYKIVNGREGIIVDIKYSADDEGRRYAEAVHVRIDRCTLKAPGLDKGVVPFFPTSTSIKYDIRHGQTISRSFRRRQVPLVPAYSYTDYKSQGRTLTRAIIDLASSRGQGIYVMLSRVTTLDGLLILRWFPQTKILQRTSGELREELQRLDRLDAETQRLFTSNILAPSPLRG
ncbi:hypothetical protein NMY22_g1957 [Coprinellus aureogranulatus]|nr:hypothetical protein NMY22_g1957 [Coprinellus aureogranulatus]